MINKRDIAILLGNVVDHCDRSLYIFLAPVIAPLFFPNSNELVSLTLAYLILSGEFIAKPLGNYIFAIIADNKGAGVALSYSLIGIGVFTGLIAILPDYNSIGIIAPILLASLRVIGGVFAAGESVVANLYVLEGKSGAAAMRRSYLYQSSTIAGIILASVATTIIFYVNISQIWRIPFAFGSLAALIGYFFRIYLIDRKLLSVETKKPAVYDLRKNIQTIKRHRLTIVKIIIAQNISQISYVLPFVLMNYFVPLITDISRETMMVGNNLMLIFDLIMLFVIGEVSKNFYPATIMKYASFILMVTIIPLWFFLPNSSILYVSFVRFWVVVWGIIFLCPLSIWCRQQLHDSQDRYLIIGMGSSIASVLAGKMTPSLCLFLYYLSGSYIILSLYFFVIFASCWLMLMKSAEIA